MAGDARRSALHELCCCMCTANCEAGGDFDLAREFEALCANPVIEVRPVGDTVAQQCVTSAPLPRTVSQGGRFWSSKSAI